MSCGRLAFTVSLIFWSAMTALLLRERILLHAATAESMALDAVRKIPASTIWYSIFRAEQKIGYASVAVSANAVSDAVAYRVDLYSRLLLLGGASILGELHLRDPGGITAFSLQVRAGRDTLSLSGRAHGEHRLVLDYNLGDYRQMLSGVVTPGAGFPSGRTVIDLRSLPGESIRVRGAGEEIARVQGALVPIRRYLISSGAAEVVVWLDPQGGMLRMDLPGEIALVRESKILAEDL